MNQIFLSWIAIFKILFPILFFFIFSRLHLKFVIKYVYLNITGAMGNTIVRCAEAHSAAEDRNAIKLGPAGDTDQKSLPTFSQQSG